VEKLKRMSDEIKIRSGEFHAFFHLCNPANALFEFFKVESRVQPLIQNPALQRNIFTEFTISFSTNDLGLIHPSLDSTELREMETKRAMKVLGRQKPFMGGLKEANGF